MEEMNDRLRGLGEFRAGERTPVATLRARSRTRRRRQVSATGLACAVVVAMAALTFTGGNDSNDVSTTGEDGVPPTAQTEVIEPEGDDESGGSAEVWSSVEAPPVGVRSNMVVEWTGSEVLIVGGSDLREGVGEDGEADGTSLDEDGTEVPIHEDRSAGAAAFDPQNGRWRRLPDMPFVPTSVLASTWDGSELLMLVREGVGTDVNGPLTDVRLLMLDPQAEAWQVADAPDRAADASASAFTGTEWLLWGYPYHQPDSEPVSMGYDPSTGQWRDIDAGPLSFRELPGSVWTGEEFIVFGGDAEETYNLSDRPPGEGAAYDPDSDTWRDLPPAPVTNLRGTSLLWTGAEVLVWGGSFGPSNPTDGAAYNPSSDSWRTLADPPLYGRDFAVVAWSGSRMVVTDGTPTYTSPIGASTAAYDPASDSWSEIPDPPGGPACYSTGVATPFGIYLFGGSVDCTPATTTPRDSPLRLDPPS